MQSVKDVSKGLKTKLEILLQDVCTTTYILFCSLALHACLLLEVTKFVIHEQQSHFRATYVYCSEMTVLFI